jgi:hypothetical protein
MYLLPRWREPGRDQLAPSGRCHHGRVLRDHDFHPDEPTVRIFRTPSPGVLRLDDSVAISEAVYDRVVLRHYAFAGHWFKINITTDLGAARQGLPFAIRVLSLAVPGHATWLLSRTAMP